MTAAARRRGPGAEPLAFLRDRNPPYSAGMSSTPSPEGSWFALAAALPDDLESHLRALAELVEQGELDVADVGYRAGVGRFPANVMMASRYARVAERRRDWAEAVSRWHSVRARFPNNRLAQQ